MKKIKWLIGCLLTGTVVLALTACGQQTFQQSNTSAQSQETQASGNSTQSQQSEHVQPKTSKLPSDLTESKTLVVYYSATGSTETVAGYIADTLKADIFEIIPTEPYTSDDLDWTDENSRVSQEHDDSSLRSMELTIATAENWENYDKVFIGYPIWWGIAAWPVDSFVAANDFTDKIVIPFATSSSSGIGESGQMLAEMAGTGEWLEGQRFSSSVSETNVVEWVNELQLTE